MGTPQIIVICLFVVVFTVNTLKHGQPSGNYSIWAALFRIGVWATVLYCGGFFS